jgi:hypothetical protein
MEIKVGNVYIPKPEWAGKLQMDIVIIEKIENDRVFFQNGNSDPMGIFKFNITKYWRPQNSNLVRQRLELK